MVNGLANAREILFHFAVAETQNSNPIACQNRRPFRVVGLTLRGVMLPAIQFNGQPCGAAVEIHNKSVNAPLSVNLHRIVPQEIIPQTPLLAGHIFPQFPAPLLQRPVVASVVILFRGPHPCLTPSLSPLRQRFALPPPLSGEAFVVHDVDYSQPLRQRFALPPPLSGEAFERGALAPLKGELSPQVTEGYFLSGKGAPDVAQVALVAG